MSPPEETEGAYFEHQVYSQCGLHCLNNLLQLRAFTAEDLEVEADRLEAAAADFGGSAAAARPFLVRLLSKFVGVNIGQWDVQVLETALGGRGFQIHWLDHRSEISAETLTPRSEQQVGIILNRRSVCCVAETSSRLTLLRSRFVSAAGGIFGFTSRHWTCLRPLQPDGAWYLLDSNIHDGPQLLGCLDQVVSYLSRIQAAEQDACIFTVSRGAGS